MQVKELRRQKTETNETVVEFEAGKLLVRLINTYDSKRTLDDLIYIMACRKLAERLA